jgi:hypothetical protein
MSVFVLLASLPLAPADLVTVGDHPCYRYEWRASTFTLGTQHEADLAVAPDGQIVAVWSSRRQQEGRAGVYAQRFDPSGVARGTETAVALWSQGHQTQPAVAVDSQGGIWVAWQSHGQDGDAGTIVARRFDPQLVGDPEVIVNQQGRGHQSQPALAVSPAGQAVVVWASQPGAREPMRLRARLLDPDGQPRGDELAVSAAPSRTETAPSVAFGRDGNFVIVFSVFDENMRPAGIRGQRLDASGQPLGGEIPVSGPLKLSQIEPVIAAGPDGYLVAWLDAESDGDDYGVLARRFDLQGRPVSDPQVVNTTRQGPQNAAAVAVAPDGRLAIAWNSPDGDEAGIFAQLLAADGTPLGSEFRMNRFAKGPQQLHAAVGTRRLAFGPRGELLCVWSGDADLGDKSSVNVTMLSPRPLDLASQPQGVTPAMRPAERLVAQATAEPHRPPTFDARLIDRGEREIRQEGRFGFDAILNTGWTPPDPHLAVGPSHLVVMTNGAIAFFEKDGTKTFQDEIEDSYGFWGSVGATGFVFDPEVLYDELSGRFFAMAAEGYAPPSETRSYVLIAVSDDSDPNGTWYKYRFDTTALAGNLFDSPNIAVDANVVYITGDGFGVSANYPVYTFDKASLLAGLPPAVQRSLTLATSTQSAGIPPVSFDNPPALYMIEHGEATWGGNTSVRLIALRDPLGSPYFSTCSLTVPKYYPPEDPPQLGTSVRPAVFDARFWSVAYRDGSLWATHHVDNARVRARWYQIAMNNWPVSANLPQLVQSGEIDFGGTIRTFFSAIGVNARGDAAITCARSSPSEYISMVTAYRYASDPPGVFRTPVVEKVSSGPYPYSRWGDYGGLGADLATPNVLWAHHEYAQGNSWRTWVARVGLPRGDLNCDGEVNFGDINPFVLALSDLALYQATYPGCPLENRDINGDGSCDFRDINPFVALLSGS